MRHRKNRIHLNRTGSHKHAMFRNMAVSLIQKELIKTTVAKAKELRRIIEPLITLAKKDDNVVNRRSAFSKLRDDQAIAKLFKVLAPRFAERNGGYLRIIKCNFRAGDNAKMAFVELLDRPQ